MNLKALLFVFLGGGLGSSLRYLIDLWLKPSIFPWGTLTANSIGCFLIGVFVGYFNRLGLIKDPVALFFIVGFCGGLTTFSSFSLDLFHLSKGSSVLYPLIYFIGTVILGMLSLVFGLWINK